MSGQMDPGMWLQIMQALGGMQGAPGLGMAPGMAAGAAQPGGPIAAGPPPPGGMPGGMLPTVAPPPLDPQAGAMMPGVAQGGPKAPGQGFPINAATLAALGAASAGLQAGRPGPAPMAGTPSVAARAPGGFSPVYNRLPGRG
jgi:hypothetical protein